MGRTITELRHYERSLVSTLRPIVQTMKGDGQHDAHGDLGFLHQFDCQERMISSTEVWYRTAIT